MKLALSIAQVFLTVVNLYFVFTGRFDVAAYIMTVVIFTEQIKQV